MTPNRRHSLEMMPPPALLKKPRSRKDKKELEDEEDEERDNSIKIEIELLLPDSLKAK